MSPLLLDSATSLDRMPIFLWPLYIQIPPLLKKFVYDSLGFMQRLLFSLSHSFLFILFNFILLCFILFPLFILSAFLISSHPVDVSDAQRTWWSVSCPMPNATRRKHANLTAISTKKSASRWRMSDSVDVWSIMPLLVLSLFLCYILLYSLVSVGRIPSHFYSPWIHVFLNRSNFTRDLVMVLMLSIECFYSILINCSPRIESE
jgi:hypothetical protein